MTKGPCHLPLLASVSSMLPSVVKAPPLTRCPEPCIHPASFLLLPFLAQCPASEEPWAESCLGSPLQFWPLQSHSHPQTELPFQNLSLDMNSMGAHCPQEKATGLRFSGGSRIWSGMISPLPSSAAPSITPAITIVCSLSLSSLCGHCPVPSHLLGFLQFPVGFSHGSLSPRNPSPFCHLQPG